jgi:hypothetical protein
MVGCMKKLVFKQHQHDSSSPVQSFKFLLPSPSHSFLVSGPVGTQDYIFVLFIPLRVLKWGLLYRSSYYWSLPFYCGVNVTLTHSLSPSLLALWLDCCCWLDVSNVITTLETTLFLLWWEVCRELKPMIKVCVGSLSLQNHKQYLCEKNRTSTTHIKTNLTYQFQNIFFSFWNQ